ncbi:glycerophosphodiester phosphodiesterase [Gracilibacillus kekensis]|uniref:Glycerophosphoryl diester phosphodiesterase n=1 Tax=Gracilibacillus kekensis TaxID=1027249 RepID=A0A1M7QH76_9BACI|nr:glycerophosphodiester phosphodiesterase [Gracilibacillus kekensis]SHN30218.1 glycerophosphoryl diester phosphodiesterase [Gracilibacillus kekensis]
MKKISKWILLLLLLFVLVGYMTDWSSSKEMPSVKGFENDRSQSLLSPERIVNIAHRGASAHAPEHTLVSYEYAQKMGADYLEIDLHMSADGELVAIHDQSLERTTNHQQLVSEMELKEIKELDAGSWFNQKNPSIAKESFDHLEVPTLTEVIEHFGNEANYYIEIKAPKLYPEMIDKLLEVLSAHNLLGKDRREGSIIIQSFSAEALQKVHNQDPSIPLIQLMKQPPKDLNTVKQYAVGVGINYKSLDLKSITELREAELLVHAYTVNHPEKMRQLLEWGVTGIFTDYPDVLAGILE